MAKLEIFRLGICEIAELISRGDTSVLEVTQACIDYAEKNKPGPELFCADREAEAALEAAGEADRQRKTGAPLGPLHGIPLAHKDVFYRRDEVLGGGTPILQDFRPDFTATPLKRLANAGAISIGRASNSRIRFESDRCQSPFPTGPESLEQGTRSGWFIQRFRGRGQHGRHCGVTGYRHRGFHQASGRDVRHHRFEAYPGQGKPARAVASCTVP